MENEVIKTAVEEPVVDVVEEVIERSYSLRKLNDGDLYPLLKILRKIGFKELSEAFSVGASANKEDVKKVGIQVMLNMADTLIANLCNVEEDVYALWSDIAGIPVDEIKKMEFGTLPLMIYDSIGEVKNTAFFRVLVKLL